MLSNAVAKKENGYEPKNILNINNFKKYKKDIDANLLKFAKDNKLNIYIDSSLKKDVEIKASNCKVYYE